MLIATAVVALLLLLIVKKRSAPDTAPNYPNRQGNSSVAPSSYLSWTTAPLYDLSTFSSIEQGEEMRYLKTAVMVFGLLLFAPAYSDAAAPKIVRFSPLNGATGVPVKLVEVEVEFDQPMNERFSIGTPPCDKGLCYAGGYWKTPSTFAVSVNLLSDYEYKITLGLNTPFQSKDGDYLPQTEWTFHTETGTPRAVTRVMIPANFTEKEGNVVHQLEALIIRPSTTGRFPLVVMNHGTPGDNPQKARQMNPSRDQRSANEFVKRGWAVMILMRRGFGSSEGEIADALMSCDLDSYLEAGKNGADDIREAIRYAGTLPYIDSEKVMVTGVSGGGFDIVALASDPPKGLIAGINVVGSKHSARQNSSNMTKCSLGALKKVYSAFGKTARIPMLWIYVENDKTVTPDIPLATYPAFTEAGGVAKLVMVPPFKDNGHYLFGDPAGIPIWTNYVDRFLSETGIKAN